MSGGGDTPSPTLKRFTLIPVSSRWGIADADGNKICYPVGSGFHVLTSTESDGTGFLDTNTSNPPSVVVDVEYQDEVKIILSMEGYESLQLDYDGDTAYNAVSYVPEIHS